MSMDREKLLAFFEKNYLSRQEVLFKLPLNLSIDTFWPELLGRRKAKAIRLPPQNAAGKPYWYVLTDRMVATSEILCAEAMEHMEPFDPYRVKMNADITEESFFTGFVEGADLSLRDAMNFLQSGAEPETIQEQMLLNNRRAWAEMIRSLYLPPDETMIRKLARILTDEMDLCAEEYRQTDNYEIACMNGMHCELPQACCIAQCMDEYCAFLQDDGIHPLIKAAAAQAYLWAARPFPEGNERLSRMISSAVLMRGSYDFLRGISLSSIISRETFQYYKCMREILSPENEGDLTYFIEYFLEILVKALSVMKERKQAQEQADLQKEQTAQPLRSNIQNPENAAAGMDNTQPDSGPEECKDEPAENQKK